MGVGRRVHGVGPETARIMVIGEHPNRDDARTGQPFSPKRHRENDIDRFFDGVRLPTRDECFVTLWIREWCGDDGAYVQADYDRDLSDLYRELRTVQPEIIVALGREVNRLFLGDIDLDTCHALAWRLPQESTTVRQLFHSPETVVVFSAYSPAAGFRSPELSAAVAYDFDQLEAFLEGHLSVRELYADLYPTPTYTLLQGFEVCDLLADL